MISLLFSVVLVTSPSPFSAVLKDFDFESFSKHALGEYYSSMKPRTRTEFKAAIRKKIEGRLLDPTWKVDQAWTDAPEEMTGIFSSGKYNHIPIVALKSNSGKIFDIKFDGTSLLVTVTGSLQRHLNKEKLEVVLAKLERSKNLDKGYIVE